MIKYLLLLTLIIASTFAFTLKLKTPLELALKQKGEAHVWIVFKDQVDFKKLQAQKKINLDTMNESLRGHLVVNSLKEVAKKSQARVLKFLQDKKIEYDAFWISNAISIKKANLPVLTFLKGQFSEIKDFDLVDQAHIVRPIEEKTVKVELKKNSSKNPTVEAGVAWVKAPQVWAKGYRGQGITVGVIDTGAFLHNDLKGTYRGRDGNHKYSWLDATFNNRAAPYDDNVHGTHCQGTINGKSSREIVGVAPDSEWISCKFLTAGGGGNYNDALKCFQFMLAPGGDSDKRPHVVSNSYGGGVPQAALELALDALAAAGVEMVFAAGNSGSRCSSVLLPALYPQAMSVGSLNRNANTISFFSSRGPGRNGGLKPEISAPGSSVRSTDNRGGYRTLSGTSMACPHVAGVIALLWNAHPELKRNIKGTRDLLYKTALGQESTLCSSSQRSPNNVFGYGTVDVQKAVEEAERIENARTLLNYQ